MSRELADHLKYFAEIGVEGVSRDPNWRRRVPISIEDFCARFQAANMAMALAQRNAKA